jgi:hypothetical protein
MLFRCGSNNNNSSMYLYEKKCYRAKLQYRRKCERDLGKNESSGKLIDNY